MTPQSRTFRPGAFIFREGEPSSCLYLIQKGSIAVRKTKSAGFIELGRLHSNEILGELAFFDRQPRSASAVALTHVEVLEISFEALDKIYASVPDYLKTIMASVCERLRKADETIRRLQKEVPSDDPSSQAERSEDLASAADVLAATADIEIKPSKG